MSPKENTASTGNPLAAIARGKAPLAVALDAPDLETAAQWAQAVTPHVAVLKVGLELFCRYGPDVVDVVRGGSKIGLFLDLKLHDIPATVAGAARSVARLRPDFLTGRFVAGAEEEAERRLGSLERKHAVLCYDPQSAEFVELRPDGRRVLELIGRKGSLGALLEGIDPGDLPALENVRRFAAELHRMGVLTPARS